MSNLGAFMAVRGGAYILKAGSYIRKEPRDSFVDHSYYELWKQITSSDAVKATESKHLIQSIRDIEFRSPSGAAAIARGGQTNGRTDWKRLSDDKALYMCESE